MMMMMCNFINGSINEEMIIGKSDEFWEGTEK